MSGGSLIRRVVLAGFALLCLPATAQAAWTSNLSGSTATMTGTTNGLLVIDAASDNVRHNRDSAGDPGFDSEFDFDTVTAGVQPLANVSTSIVDANGDGVGDAFQVGSGTVPASQLQAAVDADGDGGTDNLTFENTADTVQRSYVVGDGEIAGHGGGRVTYADVETLFLNTGTAADDIGVQGPIPTSTAIDGNTGNDRVAPQDGLAPLPTFDGDSGADTYDFGAWTTPVAFTLGPANPDVENATGGSAADTLTGDGVPNTIVGGLGADAMSSQASDDFIAAVDGVTDASIDCGPGLADIANIDAGVDPEPTGCETVNRISGGGGPEGPGGGADSDNDGVPDAADACPNVAGSSSNNGCPPPTAADRDGDGTADASDRCPDRAGAAAASGCPELARELSIDRRKGAYKGKLRSRPAQDACTDDVRVTVYRKVKGADDKIGKDRTDTKGKYEVEGSGKDGKYYAEAEAADESPEAVCLAAKSKNVKVG
jgi:hypothetical protein